MKRWFAFGAVNGALAVAAGAFAAHGLKSRLAPDLLAVFETAARYHLIHALALCLAAVAAERLAPRPAKAAAVFFAVGILLFSGSLYLLALTGTRGFGFVTPFGGAAFIAGWLALAGAAWPRKG
jgi:uncharacterized membrane protein YgdD (TMEM256/DUF423 family)